MPSKPKRVFPFAGLVTVLPSLGRECNEAKYAQSYTGESGPRRHEGLSETERLRFSMGSSGAPFVRVLLRVLRQPEAIRLLVNIGGSYE